MMIGTRVVLGTYRDRTVLLSKLQPRQIAILLFAAPLILLGTSGWTERLMFASPSPTKYALTVAIPLVATAVVLAPDPFLVFVSAAIIAGPAATLTVSFVGVSFQALTVACLLAGVPVLLGLTRPVGRSALGRALPAAAVLVAVPVATGTGILEPLTVALAAVAVVILCARAVQSPGGITVVLCSSLASLVVQAVLAIWEYQTRSEFDLYSGTVYSTANYFFDFQSQPRPTGTFPDPISLGTTLVVAVPIGMVAIHLLLEQRKWVAAAVTGALVAVVGTGLALSLSRMATIGGLVGLIAAVVFVPRTARLRVARLTGGIVAVLLVGALSLGGASLLERASSVSDPTAAGVATADGDRDREYLWQVAVDTGLEHPVWGVGVGGFNNVLLARAPGSGMSTHAHSTYLQVFAESGALGLAALAVLAAGLYRDVRRARRRAPVLTAGLAGALVALAVAAVTDVVIIRYVAVAATIAPIVGIVVGLAGQERRDRG